MSVAFVARRFDYGWFMRISWLISAVFPSMALTAQYFSLGQTVCLPFAWQDILVKAFLELVDYLRNLLF